MGNSSIGPGIAIKDINTGNENRYRFNDLDVKFHHGRAYVVLKGDQSGKEIASLKKIIDSYLKSDNLLINTNPKGDIEIIKKERAAFQQLGKLANKRPQGILGRILFAVRRSFDALVKVDVYGKLNQKNKQIAGQEDNENKRAENDWHGRMAALDLERRKEMEAEYISSSSSEEVESSSSSSEDVDSSEESSEVQEDADDVKGSKETHTKESSSSSSSAEDWW